MNEEPKKRGRKPGPKKAPTLHPSTLCSLAGRWTIGEGAPPATKPQTARALAATNSTLDPRLVELVFRIEATRGVSALRPLHRDEVDRLARAARIAAAVGDSAFFSQAAEAMNLAAKCNGLSERLVVLESWMEARKTNNPPKLADIRAGVKYRLGHIDADSPPDELRVIEGHIGDDTLRDHLKALGRKWVSRRKRE
jgi:hypothetical protein